MSDLREFIKRVEELGELMVVEGADWNLEIGSIAQMVAARPNPPALLFDKIQGYQLGWRVFSLAFTTDKRAALLLGMPLELKGIELVRALKDKLKERFERVPPVEVKDGPVMENVHMGSEVDLFAFPTPHWHHRDGGRYIGTGDIIIQKDPEEGWVNLGTYRVQLHDKTTATIFMEGSRHGTFIRKKYWDRGQSCPVAVCCGEDPLLFFAGSSGVPWGVSEYDYTGWWRKQPVEVIKGPTTGLPIPASAEIVLEGEIVPPEVETRLEGPFSEWTGHFSPSRQIAAFRVKCVMHRNNPIMFGNIPFVGRGIRYWVGDLIGAARVWNELDRLTTGIKGVWADVEFGPRGALIISLEQKYGGQAKHVALMALAVRSHMQKYIILVDDDIDPSNTRDVHWAMGLRSEPEESIEIIRNTESGDLDPRVSPQKRAIGDLTHSSAIISALKPFHWIKEFPPTFIRDRELEEKLKQKFDVLRTE
jgi:UbiD family decarboxylase